MTLTTGRLTNQDLDPVSLRRAFGSFPTGVVAVAAEIEGVLLGLAVSSFTSVSLEPPLISINLAKSSKTWPDLRRAAELGVTVLADHHAPLCRQLSGPVEHRFDDVAVTVSERGGVTLDEGLTTFSCSIYGEVEAGDHLLVLLELQQVASDQVSARGPLVFHASGFGSLHPHATATP